MVIELDEQAQRDLADLPRSMHVRYDDVLDRLEEWPEVSGVKRLAGSWQGHARIRFGVYRLIFRVDEERGHILIVRIAHRKSVYAD